MADGEIGPPMTGATGIVLGSAAFLHAQSEIIDVIAAGTELRETLRRVALIIENLIPDALCSTLLLDPDGLHLRHGAAPSLPASFLAAIDGLEIGPCVGSCGTAAYKRHSVIVEDIATDPLWVDHRHLPLSFGLKACWSQPILDSTGAVLATFALYYREPKAPSAADLRLVDLMSRLVRIAVVQDRRERELMETDQKLRDYVSLSSDWLWEHLDMGRRFSASSSALGIDQAMLRGDPSMGSLIRGIEAQVRHSAGAEIAGRRSIRDARASYKDRDGAVHFLNVNAMPVFDPRGQYRGYRGIAQDISRQVAAETESQRLRIEAEDANRAKTEFLANISHELRTPLNAILGFSEIMLHGIGGPLSERHREYAADIHRAGQHLHALVTDILDLSRIEMGRIELDEEIVTIPELVKGCVNMLRMRAIEQGVRLTVEPLPDPPSLRCDRLRLMQALINLVANAIKFTPASGAVTIAANVSDAGVSLSVVDTGIGMRPEDLPRALEPFRQINPKPNRSSDGVGLGLALAKSLVELHGGRLELASAPGEGTTATIHLPATRVIAAEELYRP
jgi:PAS domain S-box-containing protein